LRGRFFDVRISFLLRRKLLAFNHHSLATEGANCPREMLHLYDLTGSAVSRRQIAGITGLEHVEVTA